MAQKGVTDHFTVTFVATKTQDNQWLLTAIEIKLRQGGTTHSMMALKALTNGEYSINEACFKSLTGKQKFYIASDEICDENLRSLLPIDVVEHFSKSDLQFNSNTERGVVFHLLGSMSKYGRVGVTCIADSHEEAEEIFKKTVCCMKEISCAPISM